MQNEGSSVADGAEFRTEGFVVEGQNDPQTVPSIRRCIPLRPWTAAYTDGQKMKTVRNCAWLNGGKSGGAMMSAGVRYDNGNSCSARDRDGAQSCFGGRDWAIARHETVMQDLRTCLLRGEVMNNLQVWSLRLSSSPPSKVAQLERLTR